MQITLLRWVSGDRNRSSTYLSCKRLSKVNFRTARSWSLHLVRTATEFESRALVCLYIPAPLWSVAGPKGWSLKCCSWKELFCRVGKSWYLHQVWLMLISSLLLSYKAKCASIRAVYCARSGLVFLVWVHESLVIREPRENFVFELGLMKLSNGSCLFAQF